MPAPSSPLDVGNRDRAQPRAGRGQRVRGKVGDGTPIRRRALRRRRVRGGPTSSAGRGGHGIHRQFDETEGIAQRRRVADCAFDRVLLPTKGA